MSSVAQMLTQLVVEPADHHDPNRTDGRPGPHHPVGSRATAQLVSTAGARAAADADGVLDPTEQGLPVD